MWGMDGMWSILVDACVRVDRLSGVGGSYRPVAPRGFLAVFLFVRSLLLAGQV